jgi:hypothetical protein
VKGALDLLDLPFSFWQLPLLSEAQFTREARARGVLLSPQMMELLHRMRLLTPLYRVQRDGRAIAAAVRRNDPFAWREADWLPMSRTHLVEACEVGRVHDPAEEHFIARQRLDRQVGDIPYRASAYLYSHHQLLMLQTLKRALPVLASANPEQRKRWRNVGASSRETVIALSALEPIYFPRVGGLRAWQWELEEYDKWQKNLRADAMLTWLEVDADWIKGRADGLLDSADFLDPLGNWIQIVREAPPEMWETLKDDARSAIDLRIGAEILLGYYERLATAHKAPALAKPTGRFVREYANRLKPTGKLDRLLMDFGISPHPRLVLVVEGDTELLILPRVMAVLGIRTDREFIAVENARSVDTDLSALVAYAIAPRTEPDEQGRYLRLQRPPTRLLVMMDAEGPYEVPQGRKNQKGKWIERIMLTLPSQHRTTAVEESIRRLVSIDTWDRKGQSFEFAHFTDHELNRAVAEVRRGRSQPDRTAKIAEIRQAQGNLKKVLGSHTSKLKLAEALWPILERKIERSRKHGTQERLPVVRALYQAQKMARGPRRGIVIPLEKAQD